MFVFYTTPTSVLSHSTMPALLDTSRQCLSALPQAALIPSVNHMDLWQNACGMRPVNAKPTTHPYKPYWLTIHARGPSSQFNIGPIWHVSVTGHGKRQKPDRQFHHSLLFNPILWYAPVSTKRHHVNGNSATTSTFLIWWTDKNVKERATKYLSMLRKLQPAIEQELPRATNVWDEETLREVQASERRLSIGFILDKG